MTNLHAILMGAGIGVGIQLVRYAILVAQTPRPPTARLIRTMEKAYSGALRTALRKD